MNAAITSSGLMLKQVSREKTQELSDSQYDLAGQGSYLKKAIEANPELMDNAHEIVRVMDTLIDALKGDRSCWGVFLGEEMIGYVNIVRPAEEKPMLQYEIRKAYQRKGYGAEAVSTVLRSYFEKYPGKSVYALIRPDNTASVALIKKLNGKLIPPESRLEEVLFSTYQVPAVE